jgi:predicted nuclease with RNAse H fold
VKVQPRIVAGIDLAAGRGTTEVALLELAEGQDAPIFRPEDHHAVTTDDEILAALAAARPTVVAIDAPLSPPAAVAAALRDKIPSVEVHSRRLVESSSPYTRAAERDLVWRALGLRPLPVSFLGGLAFRAIVLVPRARALLPACAVIEVFPTATLRMLGIRPPVAGTKREAKTSIAARGETQQGLARYIRGLPIDGEPLGADLLDALAAALTAVAYVRGEVQAIGDAEEGQIMLPGPEFERRTRHG